MAIYSLNISSTGAATAALSYIASMRVRDEATGRTFYGYGRRERVAALDGAGSRCRTLLPEGAPAAWADPERLFNAAVAAERHGTGMAAKKIMVALPRELDDGQRIEAVEAFIRRNLTANGYAATYALHTDKDGNNPHAHILVANRRIDPKTGEWARLKQKTTFALDENGQRIPIIDPDTGVQKVDKRNRKQWKRVTVSANPLGTKDMLLSMREDWADVCNGLLPEGVSIDHRSLKDQKIDRVPTIHEGYAAREIEKRGGESDRVRLNREIRADNRHITARQLSNRDLRADIANLTGLLRELADHAMRAFDRMLERVRLTGDAARETARMEADDGVTFSPPRRAGADAPAIWRALDRHGNWQELPPRLLKEAMRTAGSVLKAIDRAKAAWKTDHAMKTPQAPQMASSATLGIDLQGAKAAVGRAWNDLLDARDELEATGRLRPLRRREASRRVQQAQSAYDAAKAHAEALQRQYDQAKAEERREKTDEPERTGIRSRKGLEERFKARLNENLDKTDETPEYGYSLASEAKQAKQTAADREAERRSRQPEWDPSDPADPMNLAMGTPGNGLSL